MRLVFVRVFFLLIRGLERRLSVRSLYRVAKPFACLRAAFKRVRHAAPMPACFGRTRPFQVTRRMHANFYLNSVLECFPDRLALDRWNSRCRFAGLEDALRAAQGGRPMVLVFCHFGPFYLLRFWLRAAGIPVATLVKGRAESRVLLKRMKDGVSPFADIPPALYQDQVRDTLKFLAAGNWLLVALDGAAGRQLPVPIEGEGNFLMATGALRLAVHAGAELVPCCIIDEGRWRFRVELGRPIPCRGVAAADLAGAGKKMLEEMLPHFKRHPEQCSLRLIHRFRNSVAARTSLLPG